MKTSRVLHCFLCTNVMFWTAATLALAGLLAYTYLLPQGLAVSGWGLMCGLYVLAGFVWLTGFIGCCGGVRINMFCMHSFMFLAAALFVVELGFFIYLGVDGLNQINNLYDGEYFVGLDLDQRYPVQTRFNCCGVNGVQDYVENGVQPDISCFTETVSGEIITYQAVTTGCQTYLADYYVISFASQCALIGVVVYVQIFGLGMGHLLIKRIKRQREKREAADRLKAEKEDKKRARREKQKQGREDEQKLITSSQLLVQEDPAVMESADTNETNNTALDRQATLPLTTARSADIGSSISLDRESGHLTPVDNQ